MDKDADIIFGASIDADMNNEVSITVLATGFDMKEKPSVSYRKPGPATDPITDVHDGAPNTPLYFDRSKSAPSFRRTPRTSMHRKGILGYLQGLFR